MSANMRVREVWCEVRVWGTEKRWKVGCVEVERSLGVESS